MKISTQQIESLLRQEELKKTHIQSPGADFEAMLNQEIGQKTASAQPIPGMPTGVSTLDSGALLASVTGQQEDDAADDLDLNIGKTAALLDAWESYAGNLKTAGQDPKALWNALSSMDSQVKALRAGIGQDGKSAGLEGLLNELEVMTAAEKIKFNRGDYL